MRTLEAIPGAPSRRKGMLKQSENIVHRLFTRQICRSRPNTHIHQSRKLYENIVPSHTVYDVECPDQSFRKFTNDGQYLICFSRNHQDLIVYRHKWLNFCVKGEASDQLLDLPPKSRTFDSYFSQLYTIPLAVGTEAICKDFFLSTENGLHGIFATSTVPDNSNTTTRGAVPGVPSTEKITISLVSLADGRITDQRAFHDDFIHLAHNMGVFLYDDLLAILSIRFQCVRIFQIRDTGRFVDVRTIGEHCREDDELVLNSQAQEEESHRKQQASFRKARGLPSAHDPSIGGKLTDTQEYAWPPLWNKHAQSIKREERNKRHASRSMSVHGPNTSGQAAQSESDDVLYDGMHNADLDLQYENYFRGLFATLEDSAASQIDGLSVSDIGRSTPFVPGNVNRQERVVGGPQQAIMGNSQYGGGGALQIGDSQQPSVATGQVTGERTGAPLQPSMGNGQSTRVELRTAYAPLDSVYDNLQGGRNPDGSTSGSGGYYSSSGPSWHGRSYTSTSGSSLDRYIPGRGSPLVRYPSSTMTSSDSGNRSEGSRRDVSVSGGSISYGSGRNGDGSVSVRSEGGNLVEYVVSSRILEGTDEGRPLGRGLMDNVENVNIAGTNTANGHTLDQRWPNESIDEPTSSDHTLPSRPGEGGTSVSDMVVVQARTAGRPPVSLRENVDGNIGRGVADAAQVPNRPAREGENRPGSGMQRSRPDGDAGVNNEEGWQVLGGIKQRLLSFIFQGVWNENVSPILKAQRLKRFYYHFQHYIDLVMWKVQFLDRYHLLIKFGSVDGVLQRNSDTSHQTAFLAIFNFETTEMLGFYQNSSEEFLLSFEQFCDHFRVAPRYPLYMNFISSYSNCTHVRDQLRKQRVACNGNKAGTFLQVVKRTLAWVPFNSQCQSPSAYFDQSLFHYDEKLISAMDRHKPCMEHPIKFISRRRPNSLKFKINPGPEFGTNDTRTKRVASFIFHPIFPFAISVQQSFMQPPIVNLHFRK